MQVKPLIRGLATYVPGTGRIFSKGTGGTDNARYCYSVWLRHLVVARENGLQTEPEAVAELGPGDSVGVGLAALISGADKYYALDVVEHADIRKNLEIFEELLNLFKAKEDVPGEGEFPQVKPYLDSYEFPNSILSDDRLNASLNEARIERIRDSIIDMSAADSMITYRAPWLNLEIIKPESVDMTISQAVLEHVDDLRGTYEALYTWLESGGFMSHQIDFRCHGTAAKWNGHWTYSDLVWRLIRGNRPYLLNRQPYSTHINLMKDAGFTVVCERRVKSPWEFDKKALARRFRDMSEDDLTTSGAFVQAVKESEGKRRRCVNVK